jgi:tRNA (guanine-N7-)-methyltransferase
LGRFRQHVNPLKASFFERSAQVLALPPGRDVEVELGCADAQFLFQRAALQPSGFYVGLEIREDLAAEVNARAHRQGVPVRVLFSHANIDYATLFPPASLARVFVNFPDPWFKRRHRKRRVVDAALASDIAASLAPGGELFFQSDVWSLALDALAVLEAEPRLANRAGAWSFWKGGNPYGVKSRREAGCEESGELIWRLLYRKAGATAAPSPGSAAP